MPIARIAPVAWLALSVWTAPALAAEPPLAMRPDDAAIKWGPCPPIFPSGCQIGVLHGDPSKPNADVFLRVAAGQVLPSHTHTSAERMVLAAGEMKVKYRGAGEVTLTPGTYAYGPASLPHSAACVGGQPCVLFIAFEGPVDAHAHAGPLD